AGLPGEHVREERVDAFLGDFVALVRGLELRLAHDLAEDGPPGRGPSGGGVACACAAAMKIVLLVLRSGYFFSSPPPSSLRSFSLVAGSVTSDWIFLRNSGRLPRGPLSAVSASRSSRSFWSSGTCLATASGSMSLS